VAPAVTFSNLGGGHFSQQFTFGSNSNLPGGVAATISADWHGLTFTGQQGLVFSVGPINAAPPVVAGTVVFNANGSILRNLSIGGEVAAAQDVNVSGKLTAKQIVSPTIDSLLAAIQNSQATIQNSEASIQQMQADIQNIYNDIAALTSRL